MKYEFEVYELCSSVYTVEAESIVDAVTKLRNGDSEGPDDSPQYIEDAENYGMSLENENPFTNISEEDYRALSNSQFNCDGILCGIRNIVHLK